MEPQKTSLLQLLLLVHLAGLYGLHAAETVQITLAADNGGEPLCLPWSSLSQTWNVTGPKGSQVELNCAHLTLLEDADCTQGFLSILDSSGEEKICKDIQKFTRESFQNWMTIEFKTGANGTAQINKKPRGRGLLACAVHLKKTDGGAKGEFSPSTDTGDYPGAQDNKKTSERCQRANKKRIIGGEPAIAHEYPFMAYIFDSDGADAECGATILTRRHLLSASHCVEDAGDISGRRVVVGGHDIYEDCDDDSNAQYLAISTAYKHEQYGNHAGIHDIVVLLLNENITFNQFVQPVILPDMQKNLVDRYVKALGWGNWNCNGARVTTLHWANLKVVNLEKCQANYPEVRISLDTPTTVICTFEPGKDTCKGDSGGPLVYENPNSTPELRYIQVGVITGGSCGLTKPGINLDVHPYIPWIKVQIGRYKDEALTIKQGGIDIPLI